MIWVVSQLLVYIVATSGSFTFINVKIVCICYYAYFFNNLFNIYILGMFCSMINFKLLQFFSSSVELLSKFTKTCSLNEANEHIFERKKITLDDMISIFWCVWYLKAMIKKSNEVIHHPHKIFHHRHILPDFRTSQSYEFDTTYYLLMELPFEIQEQKCRCKFRLFIYQRKGRRNEERKSSIFFFSTQHTFS